MKVGRLIAALVVSSMSQWASASEALLDFSAAMRSFTADFTQTVYDSDSVVLQESSGKVALVRPGKFRWTYDQPIKQLIVADGLTLWVYDEDIQQVTMQPQATTLGSAPIGLLSGERAIESEFNIIDLGEKDNLAWFQLEPLVKDTDFNAVYIALDGVGLSAMELRDNFDQATQIRFNNFKMNIDIPPAVLQFEPPAGADVVGEAGVPVGDGAQPAATPSMDDTIVQPPVTGTETLDPLDNNETLVSEDAPQPGLEELPNEQLPGLPDEQLSEQPNEQPDGQPGEEVAEQPGELPVKELVDDGPPIADTLLVIESDEEGEITFEEIIVPAE